MATQVDKRAMAWRQWTNLAAFVLILLVTVLGVALRYNNMTIAGVASQYNPDFWMAEFTGYILGFIIFVALLAFVIYQLYPKTIGDKEIRMIDYPFWALAISGSIWTFAFYYDVQWLALLAGIFYTAFAVRIYRRLCDGAHRSANKHYWLIHFPFALIMAHTLFSVVAQFALFCTAYSWTCWGVNQAEWTMIAMLLLAFVGAYLLCNRSDVAVGLTFAWSYIGIATYQMGESMMVTATAAILAFFFALVSYLAYVHNKTGRKV